MKEHLKQIEKKKSKKKKKKKKTSKHTYLALNIDVSIFMQQSSDNLHMASSHCCDQNRVSTLRQMRHINTHKVHSYMQIQSSIRIFILL